MVTVVPFDPYVTSMLVVSAGSVKLLAVDVGIVVPIVVLVPLSIRVLHSPAMLVVSTVALHMVQLLMLSPEPGLVQEDPLTQVMRLLQPARLLVGTAQAVLLIRPLPRQKSTASPALSTMAAHRVKLSAVPALTAVVPADLGLILAFYGSPPGLVVAVPATMDPVQLSGPVGPSS